MKLGNNKFHDIHLNSDDVKLGVNEGVLVYLDNLRDILQEYKIHRITPIECKQLYNKQFINLFEEKFITNDK